MRDIDVSGARRRLSGSRACRRRCSATPRCSGSADFVELYEDDARLPEAARARGAGVARSDRSFASYRQTRSRTSPVRRSPSDTDVLWNQADARRAVRVSDPVGPVAVFDPPRPGAARRARRDRAALPAARRRGARLRVLGDPGLVRLDPRWHQAALRFVELGFFHILDGTDHLLFLLCLVIPFRRFRALRRRSSPRSRWRIRSR